MLLVVHMLDKSIYDLAFSVALHRKWAIVLTFDVSNAKCDQQKTITNTEVLHEELAFSVEASRFILQQNAPLRHLIFQNVLRSSNFQNILSNCSRMQHLASFV